jgi:hypothetical protein
MASAPYTRKNGVRHVDLLGVVLRLHIIDGNSSAQADAARCRGASRRGLIPDRITPLVLSTWPLDYGCATDTRSRQIPL